MVHLGDGKEKVKMDIVSGFLGSGKTTLIRKILQSLPEEKIVIIENEYGEIQIDKEVLRVAGFDIYELTNGCVCCSLKEDFRLILRQILEQDVDRIIFEPSGIFILSEIFELFQDPVIAEACELNSVITVVDGVNFYRYAQGVTGFFANQIEGADVLLISKSQLVDLEQVEKIKEELRRMNSQAVIIAEPWENLGSKEIQSLMAGNILTKDSWKESLNGGKMEESLSGHSFDTVGMATKKAFSLEGLEELLEGAQKGIFGDVVRAKGIVPNGNEFWEFNYILGDFDIRPTQGDFAGMVSFIGKDLDKEKITECFT